jgi:hypothetical protein
MAAPNISNPQLEAQVYPFTVPTDGTRPKDVGIRACMHILSREKDGLG